MKKKKDLRYVPDASPAEALVLAWYQELQRRRHSRKFDSEFALIIREVYARRAGVTFLPHRLP
ncbi:MULTISPECIES: hypothetical protein [Methylopilaceae]|nr:hypothetical protein [Hansschlegelia zhihuaiae]RXF69980.1 hypothetical protein EK403_17805 [Hansschlegelia zhihuaiae]